MDRAEFEQLRSLPGKRIISDIRFAEKPHRRPALVCGDIPIENTGDVELKMDITFNPASDSISINVTSRGEGPICRLDVRSNNHREAGRTHKHELTSNEDISDNLPQATGMPALAAYSLRDAFFEICRLANIQFLGTFVEPSDHTAAASP